MGDFSVDVTSLRALSWRLRAGANELGAALAALSGATPGRLGTPSLDEACQDFQQQWQHGMSLIRENVTMKFPARARPFRAGVAAEGGRGWWSWSLADDRGVFHPGMSGPTVILRV